MSNELWVSRVEDSGSTIYAVIINEAGNYWNGSAFISYSSLVWTTAAIILAENTGTGTFFGNFPAAITPRGRYSIEYRRRDSATPKITDGVIYAHYINWAGSPSNEYIGLEDIEEDTATLAAGSRPKGFSF